MKNKLTKTGHKKFYYRFRNVSLGCLVAIALGGLIALPISISYQNEKQLANAAEASNHLEAETLESESVSVSEYIEA